MTNIEYERYKGLCALERELNNFNPSTKFTAQTDRWGAEKVGGKFITSLNKLIADTLLEIKERKEDL